jgi:AraC family transcriptional regulator
MTVNYIYSSWLLQSGLRHTYGCDLEFYGSEYEANSEKSVIYYAIPVAPA